MGSEERNFRIPHYPALLPRFRNFPALWGGSPKSQVLWIRASDPEVVASGVKFNYVTLGCGTVIVGGGAPVRSVGSAAQEAGGAHGDTAERRQGGPAAGGRQVDCGAGIRLQPAASAEGKPHRELLLQEGQQIGRASCR